MYELSRSTYSSFFVFQIEYVENSTSTNRSSLEVKWKSPQKYPAGKITIRLILYCLRNKTILVVSVSLIPSRGARPSINQMGKWPREILRASSGILSAKIFARRSTEQKGYSI